MAHQIHNHFEEQQQQLSETRDTAAQTAIVSENNHIGVETNRLTFENRHTQFDAIEMVDQQSQTGTFEQLWSEADDKNLFNFEDEDDRLRDYLDEISTIRVQDLSDRLAKECRQVLSKRNVSPSSYSDLQLNPLALLTVYVLYNQHLTDDAKQLYNETLIRALKQEYELINNEKLDSVEKYHALEDKHREELTSIQKKIDKLQAKYDELLEHSELERLDSTKLTDDLSEQHALREKQLEYNLFNLHQENETLKYSLNSLDNDRQRVAEKDYEQLRQDYNDLINENELLKEYNSQMYQQRLQRNRDDGSAITNEFRDVAIQCGIPSDVRPSNAEGSAWNSDWEEETTLRDSPTQEQGMPRLSKKEETSRLKTISEMEPENSSLKESNSRMHQTSIHQTNTDSITHDIGIHCSLQSGTVYGSGQADVETEADSTMQTFNNPTDSTDTEDNDWNSQMSTFEIASEDDNMPAVVGERVFRQTVNTETQTDEQPQDKLTQVNTKLKRALQTIKDKIHQAVLEQPEVFSGTSDDTIERLDHLIVTMSSQATQIDNFQSEREEMLHERQQPGTEPTHNVRAPDTKKYEKQIQSLTSERDDLLERNKQLEDDVQEMQSNIYRSTFEPRMCSDNSTQTVLVPELQPTESVRTREHEQSAFTERLFGFVPTSHATDSVDSETQTDETPHEKLTQVNSKLKRALQTIKEKIYQAVVERPYLFPEVNDDTLERLDCLIATIGNQANYIENLQSDCNHAQREINELRSALETRQQESPYERETREEQLVTAAPTADDKSLLMIEECQKQINQLQEQLSKNEDERTSLGEHLDGVETTLKKSSDDHASTISMYEQQLQSLIQERDAAVEQHIIQTSEKLHEIEQLQEELEQLKQPIASTTQTDNPPQEEIRSLQEVIQQQSEEIRDLTDRYLTLSTQIEAQGDFEKQRKETEKRLANYENQIELLTRERSELLEEIQKNAATIAQLAEYEKQTGDLSQEKLAKLNSKLKRALQTFKDKICRLVIARPDLFVNIGEETSERFDHVLYTVEHQAARIDLLQDELTECEEHFRDQIRELQSSLESCQGQVSFERSARIEPLVFGAPTTEYIGAASSTNVREGRKQIGKLRQKLSSTEDERALLRQRLNEVELELRKTSDDHASAISTYEQQLHTLMQEKSAVLELHALRSAENQQEIEELKEELRRAKGTARADDAFHEDMKALQDVIQQQAEEIKDLTDRYVALSSQIEAQDGLEKQRKEVEERLLNYEQEIENLVHERAALLEEAQKNATLLAQAEQEKQSGDPQQQKLSKVNSKLKRALQSIKEKIHRLATERPELFVNIGEETAERLDHLISFVEYQAAQVNALQSELDQTQEQFRDEIRDLQNALGLFQNQINSDQSAKTEPLHTETSPSEVSTYMSSSVFESEQQQQITQLQEKLSENETERTQIRNRLTDVEQEFRKTLDECASTLSIYEQQIQELVRERDGLLEQRAGQSEASQREIEQLQNELAGLKQQSTVRPIRLQTNEAAPSWDAALEQQTKRRRDVSDKYMNLLSQLDSNIYLQAELDKLGRETEQQLMNYESQIEQLVRERANLLEEKQTNAPSIATTTNDTEKPIATLQNDKLVKINSKLKRVLQNIREKIQRVVADRPDLFVNVGEETTERLDHLIDTVENQAAQIGLLQSAVQDSEGRLQDVVQQLQSSFDLYRQQAETDRATESRASVSIATVIARKIEPETSERTLEIHSKQASNEEHWNDWSTESIHCADERVHFRSVDVQCELLVDRPPSVQEVSETMDHRPPSVTSRLFGALRNMATSLTEEPSVNDWEEQNSPRRLATDERAGHLPTTSHSPTDSLIQTIANEIHQIVSENPHLFPQSTGDALEDLNQLIHIIRNFQKEINDLQSSFDVYRRSIESERSMNMGDTNSNHFNNQTLSLSAIEQHRREIDELRERLHENGLIYQQEIDRLLEERNQTRGQSSLKSLNDIPSQTDFGDNNSLVEARLSDCQSQIDVLLRERVSLMEQIKQLAHQSTRQQGQSQARNDSEPSTPTEQRISRRVFEQEMLAWSKESEQLKQFVKQIQVENKKLKDIILKFERLTHDYTQENERLKHENQQLSLLAYSSEESTGTSNGTVSSDADVCYLTLKWLTYEVAERTFDGHEQSLSIVDSDDPYLKQRLSDTERHLKSVRIQNQRLKKQLETYTIQFKHVQHEMNVKNQELSMLKIEAERLRSSETQYRLEADRLKADLQCDQVRIQQLERELVALRRQSSTTDSGSTNNLRELLELKERELNALKEKLDYTTKAHQLELQEALKANQFSLENVQRFEQLDQRHQEKRKELESRLGRFCKMIRPLIDNQHLFRQSSILDIDELQRLITDTEAEEKVTNSFGAIRDCLGLLENQMKDLHHNLIENHARRSPKWKYKVGFECLSCDSQWEVTHDIQNLQEACQDPDLFLETSRVEPMSGCSCPLTADFVESDVRLCLDDLLDEVIVRTTVK